jgi:hypothetical protein
LRGTTGFVGWLEKSNLINVDWPVLYIPRLAEPEILGQLLFKSLRTLRREKLISPLESHPPLYPFDVRSRWWINPPKNPYPIVDWIYLLGEYRLGRKGEFLNIYKTLPSEYLNQNVTCTGVAWRKGFANVVLAEISYRESYPKWAEFSTSFRKFLIPNAPEDPLSPFAAERVFPTALPRVENLHQTIKIALREGHIAKPKNIV